VHKKKEVVQVSRPHFHKLMISDNFPSSRSGALCLAGCVAARLGRCQRAAAGEPGKEMESVRRGELI
jgi:hypothetical protein